MFPQTSFVMIADDDIYLRVDRLVDELRKEDRSQRLYLGQVWDALLGRSQKPVRESTERYYITQESYPLHTYPPFGFGPHYLLSMDCVRFIAKNNDRLRGLGTIDDVSVALWLLTMQVHVKHIAAFSNLRLAACKNDLISLADLSSYGIRSVHTNLVEKRALCFGFEVAWQKEKTMLGVVTFSEQSLLDIQTYVHDLEDTEYLYITSIISTIDNAGVKVSYYPSMETFYTYSRRVCLEAHMLLGKTNSKSWVCHGIIQKLRAQVQQQFQNIETTASIGPAFLELWKYNLFVADEAASPSIVAYTPESSYASVVFECIFKTILERRKHPILVVPEKVLHAHYGNKPDVFIFSIYDSLVCESMSNPGCHEMVAYYMDQYLLPGNDNASKLMMISGEAIDTQLLDDRVPLLSSVSSVTRKGHVFLPVASISFAERLRHTPVELLSSIPTSLPNSSERRFCAYLYARCDRPYREYMFDLLNAMEPVDALGVCAGSTRAPDSSFKASRYFKWFNDEAVTLYQGYKFVVAFENSAEPGYVTEKLVNPFLAGSIPIYWGNSTTARQIFNPDTFIDCGRFESLEDCAAFVLQVHKSPELYTEMRRESPIRNLTAFNEAFSWHPSVSSRALADKVAKMLHLDIQT
ncbi:Alpha mannosyltransferase [Phytophthora megakarya]|uniref:Fucosyltransferase n=1 Tax=Phytophthora megakarya TaxID=4795 RepID=A0A225WD45_9STRA|nr:Alpha mannosyltransferase [Phytophthora megakarya]